MGGRGSGTPQASPEETAALMARVDAIADLRQARWALYQAIQRVDQAEQRIVRGNQILNAFGWPGDTLSDLAPVADEDAVKLATALVLETTRAISERVGERAKEARRQRAVRLVATAAGRSEW